MTKSKIIAGTIAALTLSAAIIGTSAPAQAHHHRFHGPGLGLLALGAVAAANVANDDDDCRFVRRHNRWGTPYVVKVCDDGDDDDDD